jgi:hypothetical protein
MEYPANSEQQKIYELATRAHDLYVAGTKSRQRLNYLIDMLAPKGRLQELHEAVKIRLGTTYPSGR